MTIDEINNLNDMDIDELEFFEDEAEFLEGYDEIDIDNEDI